MCILFKSFAACADLRFSQLSRTLKSYFCINRLEAVEHKYEFRWLKQNAKGYLFQFLCILSLHKSDSCFMYCLFRSKTSKQGTDVWACKNGNGSDSSFNTVFVGLILLPLKICTSKISTHIPNKAEVILNKIVRVHCHIFSYGFTFEKERRSEN